MKKNNVREGIFLQNYINKEANIKFVSSKKIESPVVDNYNMYLWVQYKNHIIK